MFISISEKHVLNLNTDVDYDPYAHYTGLSALRFLSSSSQQQLPWQASKDIDRTYLQLIVSARSLLVYIIYFCL